MARGKPTNYQTMGYLLPITPRPAVVDPLYSVDLAISTKRTPPAFAGQQPLATERPKRTHPLALPRAPLFSPFSLACEGHLLCALSVVAPS